MRHIRTLMRSLNATTKRLEKISIVKAFAEVALDAEILLIRDALDPLVITGVRNCPFKGTSEKTTIDENELYVKFAKIIQESSTLKKEALMADVFSRLDPDDGEIFRRILTKDLGGGLGISTWNAGCSSDPVHDYPCLLVSAYSDKLLNKLFNEHKSLICQEKCDGMRFNAIVGYDGSVSFFGRSGKPIQIHADSPIVKMFSRLHQGGKVVFDGELLVVDSNGNICDRKTGNGILNKAVRGTITPLESSRIVARVWDIIDFDDFYNGESSVPYSERLERLTKILEMSNSVVRGVETWTVESKDEAFQHFNDVTSRGGEGVILKSPSMGWKDVRSTQAVKLKSELECDLKVVDITDSKEGGKYDGLMGALVCESADGKVQTKVGTGFSDEDRRWFMDNRDKVIGKIVTVCYNMRVKDKNRADVDSLFLPRFVELREDKEEADRSDSIK